MYCLLQTSYHGLNVESYLTSQNLTATHITYMYWHNQLFKTIKSRYYFLTIHDKCETILSIIVLKSFFREFIVSSYSTFSSKGLQRYSLKKDCEKRLDLQTGLIIYRASRAPSRCWWKVWLIASP